MNTYILTCISSLIIALHNFYKPVSDNKLCSERKETILPAVSVNTHICFSDIGSNNSYNQYMKLSSLPSCYDVLLTFQNLFISVN